jgi:transcriptional/translational regulatory protein YebC/TACO1
LIERAKAANMTKDKIESAIKSGVKVAWLLQFIFTFLKSSFEFFCLATLKKITAIIFQNTGEVSHNLLIEGHGPGGCGILVDTLTSNKIRTRTEIKTVFTRNG